MFLFRRSAVAGWYWRPTSALRRPELHWLRPLGLHSQRNWRRRIHGRHTITLFRRPRTVHLQAAGPSSSVRSVRLSGTIDGVAKRWRPASDGSLRRSDGLDASVQSSVLAWPQFLIARCSRTQDWSPARGHYCDWTRWIVPTGRPSLRPDSSTTSCSVLVVVGITAMRNYVVPTIRRLPSNVRQVVVLSQVKNIHYTVHTCTSLHSPITVV